jgi:hypothetical protein
MLPGRVEAGANVLTYHNDVARTGQNTNETILTPANVASVNFGQLYTYAVDGFVYAQPLVMTNLTIPGRGIHDVVFIATEHDSVYAFDANTNATGNDAPLWHTSFINPAAGVTSVSSADVGCSDLVPEVGISGTPVIDPSTGTLYVEAKTKEIGTNGTAILHRLHALDVSTGVEKFGGPAQVHAGVPGSGDGNDGAGLVPFDPLRQLNRCGLLLSRGVVYIASASHCDAGPYHGWLIGYNAQTLAFSNLFNSTPNGGLGGFWQGGGGPACDSSGNIFLETGNGTYDGATNQDYGDSFLKLSPTKRTMTVADYFTPDNQQDLADNDLDLGAGAPVLLPDSVGSISHPHLLVGAGKEGTIYVVDRDQMGGFSSTKNGALQSISNSIGGSFDTPAYFNNNIYYIGAGDSVKAFSVTNGVVTTSPSMQNTAWFVFPGATPSISANGNQNAILWAIQAWGYGGNGPAVLRAFDATNLTAELYNSYVANQNPGPAVKFTVPTVANGKVYVGAQYSFAAYGLGNFLPLPIISPSGATYTNSLSVMLGDADAGATIYYTLDGSTPTTSSPVYSVPIIITNSVTLKMRAVKSGSIITPVVAATFLNSADIGQGTGLFGEYFSDQASTFTNPPTLTRLDPTVDFDWGDSSPDPAISGDHFTVRWTGAVQPQFNEAYTFYTTTDDGVRLWVDGQLVVDEWVDQGATQGSGSIALASRQKYSLTMEYHDNSGDASAALAWSSPSTPQQTIPQSQLYPAFPPSFTPGIAVYTSNQFQLQLFGLPGKDYVLQATADLTNWISIATNSSPPNPSDTLPGSLFNFTDRTAVSYRHRFYRVVQKP